MTRNDDDGVRSAIGQVLGFSMSEECFSLVDDLEDIVRDESFESLDEALASADLDSLLPATVWRIRTWAHVACGAAEFAGMPVMSSDATDIINADLSTVIFDAVSAGWAVLHGDDES